jgi:UDP-N-acetylglucosamine:LPS N-acetylglucosamine transferase
MRRTPRVLAVASGGGHWIQLQRLRPAFEGCEVAFASVFPDYREDVAGHRFYVAPDATRRDAWKLPLLAASLFATILRERPDVIVTTGALPGLVAIAIGRLLGRRTMWVDSIANAERFSTSGRHARRFASVWLSQWPEVAAKEGAECWGAVL